MSQKAGSLAALSNRLPLVLYAAALIIMPGELKAEPLWSIAPQTFALGVHMYGFLFDYTKSATLMQGSHRLSNPNGLEKERFESRLSFLYAPKTSMNITLDVPFAAVRSRQKMSGSPATATSQGLGDAVISIKSRYHLKVDEDHRIHHAWSLGLKLPTGRAVGSNPDGSPLDPSDQPGTGKPGLRFGYAFASERMKDTWYVSSEYQLETGGRNRKGSAWEADAVYGWWVTHANKFEGFSFMPAIGVHLERHEQDHSLGQSLGNTGMDMAGLQVTLKATQGGNRYRAGLMIPVWTRVNGQQPARDMQFRIAYELLK